jgi:hypothetical protein
VVDDRKGGQRPSRVPEDEIDPGHVLAQRGSKDYQDFRDRAAYVYATGSFPTHLRNYMSALLSRVTRYSRTPVSMDHRQGSMQLQEEIIRELGLDQHPMIRKVRDYVKQGYKIQVSRDLKARRPYSKVFLYRESGTGTDLLTVQADGAIKDRWD